MEMASTGNQHCANCIGTLSFPIIVGYVRAVKVKGKGSPYSITARRVQRGWSRFLAVSLQVTWVINHAVGCHYFPPGPQLPPQPVRGLLPILAAWWTEARWVWTVCLRLLPVRVAAAIWTRAFSAPESSTLTTRLPSHPMQYVDERLLSVFCNKRTTLRCVLTTRTTAVTSHPRCNPSSCERTTTEINRPTGWAKNPRFELKAIIL